MRTRQFDVFSNGTGYLDIRRGDDFLDDVFKSKKFSGRRIEDRQLKRLEQVADYLKRNGEQRINTITKMFGMRAADIKLGMTYIWPIYENDVGTRIGILDDDGDPY